METVTTSLLYITVERYLEERVLKTSEMREIKKKTANNK